MMKLLLLLLALARVRAHTFTVRRKASGRGRGVTMVNVAPQSKGGMEKSLTVITLEGGGRTGKKETLLASLSPVLSFPAPIRLQSAGALANGAAPPLSVFGKSLPGIRVDGAAKERGLQLIPVAPLGASTGSGAGGQLREKQLARKAAGSHASNVPDQRRRWRVTVASMLGRPARIRTSSLVTKSGHPIFRIARSLCCWKRSSFLTSRRYSTHVSEP